MVSASCLQEHSWCVVLPFSNGVIYSGTWTENLRTILYLWVTTP